MKLLQIIPSMDPKLGGPSQGIRNNIPELKKNGIQCEVVCFDNPKALYIQSSEFTIHGLGRSSKPWSFNKYYLSWLKEHISEYDAIIINGLWLYHSYATIKFLRKYKLKHTTHCPKVFVMPHGMLDPWFQKNSGRMLKAIRNSIYWHLIENKVVNESDAVLFTAAQELNLARTTFYRYRPQNEINIGYGIPKPPAFCTDFEIATSRIKSIGTEPYILFFGRINIKKGVDLLINGYLNLKSEGFSLPKLILAGPGLETPYGVEMVKLASKDKNIIFTGMLSGSDKWSALYGCEAFILPSHQENFGISVVEALACKKPVLISNQVNIFQEIEKGTAGLIETNDIKGTENLIRKWLSFTPSEKKAMAKNAYQVYLKHFSIENTVKKLSHYLHNT